MNLPNPPADPGPRPAARMRSRVLWGWIGLLAVLSASGRPAAAPVPIDGIVAQVGDEIVLASEVEEQIAVLSLRKSLPDTNLATAREEILSHIIDEKVIVQEARARGISASYEEVEDAVKKHVDGIRQQMGGDAAFQRELAKEGLTEAELLDRYRDEARRELLYTRLIQREIYSKVEITPAEAEKYFEEHKSELPPKTGRVELAHVFVALRPDPEDVKAAQLKLKEIERRMNTGDSFAAIAKDLSDDSATKEKGGDIGWLNPEDLDPRLQETVKGLPVGEVSDPLQTAQGIELLRIAERDSARVHLEHIRVNLPVSEAGKERAKRGADEVRGLALKGADFGQLAKEYSDDGESKEKGGNLGFFNSAELAPNIGQAVQGLAVGEISEVVGSDVGYHVFKVLAREGGGEWTFDEVKDRVMNVMQEERAQSMTDNWLAGVRAKYFIRRTDQPVGAAAVPAGTVPPAAVPAAAPADTPVAEPVRP